MKNEQNSNGKTNAQNDAKNAPQPTKTPEAGENSVERRGSNASPERSGEAGGGKPPKDEKSPLQLLREDAEKAFSELVDSYKSTDKPADSVSWRDVVAPVENALAAIREGGKKKPLTLRSAFNKALEVAKRYVADVSANKPTKAVLIKRLFEGKAAVKFATNETADSIVAAIVEENGEKMDVFRGEFAAPNPKKQTLFKNGDELRAVTATDGVFTTLVGSAAGYALSSTFAEDVADYRVIVYRVGDGWTVAVLHKSAATDDRFGAVKFVCGPPDIYAVGGRSIAISGKRSGYRKIDEKRVSDLLRAFIYDAYKGFLTR
jgi:hypothetical protein